MITIEFPNGVVSFSTNNAVKKAVMDILLNSPYAAIDKLAVDDADGYYLTGEIEKHAWSKDDGPYEEHSVNEYWDNVVSTLKKKFSDANAETDNTKKEEKKKEQFQKDFAYKRLMEDLTDMSIAKLKTMSAADIAKFLEIPWQ